VQSNTRGGFLPLMAIIAIAFVIAAGTTAALVLHNGKVERQPEPTAALTPEAAVDQDSARVAPSSLQSTMETDSHPGEAVEARVSQESDPDETSREDDDREKRERVAELEARQRAMDEELRRALDEHRAIADGSDANYNKAKCRQEKQSLLSRADAAYLQWWDDYQEARRGMDSCYDSNSVPVCDKRMTELNVSWQAKLDARFEPLYEKLTSCASGDREFGSISTVVSAGY